MSVMSKVIKSVAVSSAVLEAVDAGRLRGSSKLLAGNSESEGAAFVEMANPTVAPQNNLQHLLQNAPNDGLDDLMNQVEQPPLVHHPNAIEPIHPHPNNQHQHQHIADHFNAQMHQQGANPGNHAGAHHAGAHGAGANGAGANGQGGLGH